MRFGGRVLCSFLLTIVFSIADAAEFPPQVLNMGRIKFELVLGDIVNQPADVWVASTSPNSANTSKAASGAIASIDEAPFFEFNQIVQQKGGALPFGSVTSTQAGAGLRACGVKRVYHSVDYYGFQQIVFFSPEELLTSKFPFSAEDLAKYENLLEKNKDLLAQALPLFRRGLFSVFQEMVSIDGKATAIEKPIIEKYKTIYKQIHQIIFKYYPHINIETGAKSVLAALQLADADAEVSSIALPSIGSGFFGGMSLEDSIGMTLIAAYDYVQRHSQGKEITLKLVIYGRENEENFKQLSKIWQNVLASNKTWNKLADLDSRSPVTARGEAGFKAFRQNILGLAAPAVEQDVRPQPVPAAPLQRKGFFGRLCERLLK